ncbi:MAG: hypothetical protein WB816_17375, partial [Methylocystis sp.]
MTRNGVRQRIASLRRRIAAIEASETTGSWPASSPARESSRRPASGRDIVERLLGNIGFGSVTEI